MPFGDDCQYDDFAACVAANSDKEDPEAFCAALQEATESECNSRRTGMKPIRGLYLIRSGGPRVVGPEHAEQDAKPVVRLRQSDEGDGEAEADDDRLATLEVDFSRFDTWYEIDSIWEGRFMERVQKGAFKSTIARHGDRVKVLFNHGFDFGLSDRLLSKPEVLEERDEFAHLEGPLFRGTPEIIVEGLRAGAYGSSFMFEVVADTWNHEPEASKDNPEALPERTVTAVNLFEAGPVTWPANPEATSGMRSDTDWFMDKVRSRDEQMYDDLARCLRAFRAAHGPRRVDETPATPAEQPEPETLAAGDDPARHVDGAGHAAARARRLQLIDMARS